MKNQVALVSLLASVSVTSLAQAQVKDITDLEPSGWEAMIVCGTGDALGGVDVIYGASQKLYLRVLSMDEQKPDALYSLMSGVDAGAALAKVGQGEQVSLTFRSDDSVEFGGMVSQAAFLQLRVSREYSTETNSTLALNGNVHSLFCNFKGE